MKTIIGFLLISLAVVRLGHAESDRVSVIEIEDEYRVAANKYGLSPLLFKAVLTVESDLNHRAVNATTLDFGIGQINYKTAESYDIDTSRLINDRAYSIDRAAYVLSKFQKAFKHKRPDDWVCTYNVGYQTLPKRCAEYNRRIKLAMGLL
jgi:soluble lytic murein transglycosylase-like protein